MPKNPHAKALAQLGAKKGGKARARSLTPEERRDSAREAVEERWRKAGKLRKEEKKPTLAGILEAELQAIREAGLSKEERVLQGPQGAAIRVNGKEVLNFCANNYLGLSSHPEV